MVSDTLINLWARLAKLREGVLNVLDRLILFQRSLLSKHLVTKPATEDTDNSFPSPVIRFAHFL